MGNLTNGFIRYAFKMNNSEDLFFSVNGDGWANICELDILDTYGSENEAYKIFKTNIPDIIKKQITISKVIYEFRQFNKDKDWDNEIDDNNYISLN